MTATPIGDDTYPDDEIEAVSATLDAITTGIGLITLGAAVDFDGNLPPDDDAAAWRLQKLLDTLNSTYPAELISQLWDELMADD